MHGPRNKIVLPQQAKVINIYNQGLNSLMIASAERPKHVGVIRY
jgi:hypothetical protein